MTKIYIYIYITKICMNNMNNRIQNLSGVVLGILEFSINKVKGFPL